MHSGRLEKSGYVKRIAPGRWRLVDTLQGYVRSESRRHNNSDAARRLYELRAKKFELDNACRERSLIPLDDACYAVDIICGLFRSELGALAS
jgi:hypothetical protein